MHFDLGVEERQSSQVSCTRSPLAPWFLLSQVYKDGARVLTALQGTKLLPRSRPPPRRLLTSSVALHVPQHPVQRFDRCEHPPGSALIDGFRSRLDMLLSPDSGQCGLQRPVLDAEYRAPRSACQAAHHGPETLTSETGIAAFNSNPSGYKVFRNVKVRLQFYVHGLCV